MSNTSLVTKPGSQFDMYKHFVQPKLEINTPGDRYEQEADMMAEKVMRMPSTESPVKPVTGLIGASVQRKCADCEEEEKKSVMRKVENTGYGIQASPSLVSSINASKGAGSPLPDGTRNFMENAFSTDFSKVRVHADSKAAEMSNHINARAFTTGSDIYFKSGEYKPDTNEGKHLLAHELTHVLQQEPYIIKRQVAHAPAAPGPTAVKAPVLSSSEAAERVSLLLFDSNGYFATIKEQITNFKTDMMQLGWYAGERKSGTESVVSSALQSAVTEAAKAAAKKGLEILLKSIAKDVGAAALGGVGGALAGYLVHEMIRLSTYNPVVTQVASKPAHQIYVEAIEDAERSAHIKLREQWTLQRDETIKSEGVAGLSRYATEIGNATNEINSTYYSELVAGYLPNSSARSLELETPHAVYTGEGRGFTPFKGSSTYVSQIEHHDIYVELRASSEYSLQSMQIVRTVIPELTSKVLASLNSQTNQSLSVLPFNRLVIEANSPMGPARIVYNTSNASFDIPQSPHYSSEFCRLVYVAQTGDHSNRTSGGGYTTAEFSGAVWIYSWLITKPLSEMNFSA